MKVSYNWLKQYIDIPESPEEISRILTDTGLEVEGIEKFESIPGGLSGLVIGEVLTCDKHPNADRLRSTTVDVGGDSPAPIVCGAPNVDAGQKVIVALPGTTLHPISGEPFTIKKSKIRGEVSEGMICAEDEIGLGHAHDGIIILDTDLVNGSPAKDYFQLEDDYTIEIGLTPNRGDAASHIGVARDIRAALQRSLSWPDVSAFKIDGTNTPIEVVVEDAVACPRYSGICITDVKVEESPGWLQARLQSIGLTPINNIVDITNFVLHETGQPMHAFDYDKIEGHKVIVKTVAQNTLFETLDGKERKLDKNDLMICNAKEGMCIAGVFGGSKSGVTEETTNIFLEVAFFSADHIRKTATRHGLKTDASFHYERGTDPQLTVYALKRASMLIKEIAGGVISSELIDVYPEEVVPKEIPVKWFHIQRLIGKNLPKNDIIQILAGLDILVQNQTDEGFLAIVPAYRSDVTREADVIEEILRIFGFNNVDLPDTLGAGYLAEYPEFDSNYWQLKTSQALVGKGWFEIMTNSLTNESYLELDNNLSKSRTVHVINKLSEDLGVLKQTMLFTGLESVAHNLNRKQENIRFFEFGRTYEKEDQYVETSHLSLLMAGNVSDHDFRHPIQPVTYYDLSGTVASILQLLGIDLQQLEKSEFSDNLFSEGIMMTHKGNVLIKIGEVSPQICKYFEIKSKIFYADLTWDLLLNLTNHNIVYKEISKFPPVKRDLSLVIDKSISFNEIEKIAKRIEPQLIQDIRVFDVYEGERIDTNKKAYAITFILQDSEKTLTDKIIDKTMNRLMKAFEEQSGAVIRQ